MANAHWQRIYNEAPTVRTWANDNTAGIAITLEGPTRIQVWIPDKHEAERIAREIIDLALDPTTWERQ